MEHASAHPYLEAVRRRVVVFDGATGTNLQRVGLGADDFGGAELEGCNEILNLTRPDVVADLHASFLEVGATWWRPTPSGRSGFPWPSTGSPTGPTRSPRRERRSPGGWPTAAPPRTGPAGWRDPWDREPSSRSGPDPLPGAQGRLPACRGRSARGWRRPVHRRDPVRPAGRQSRRRRLPGGDGTGRPGGPTSGPGDDGAHRADAARHRDRRGPGRPRAAGDRRDRAQLRHRPRRDARAPPLPDLPLPAPGVGHPQRRPAPGSRR
ncbi:MAG: hypothetical protein KatS3mg011_0516 [Acidimicrobiia bacterium]|nr:MAG: hypothetical protein KatS3mg011_0516 [Acidimicrobiia bacterium]